MESGKDILTHPLDVRGPSILPIRRIRPTRRRNVVDQRIEPDIDDSIVISWNGNAPAWVGARDTGVAKALLNEADHFVLACLRLDELGVRVDVLQQAISKGT